MNDRERLIELVIMAQKVADEHCWNEIDCVRCGKKNKDGNNCYDAMMVDILIANGVTVQKHGRWLGTHDGWYYSYSCSECGAEALTKEETMHDQVCSAFCPNCGAKMDGERKENERL